jgi:hypothetical protein
MIRYIARTLFSNLVGDQSEGKLGGGFHPKRGRQIHCINPFKFALAIIALHGKVKAWKPNGPLKICKPSAP